MEGYKNCPICEKKNIYVYYTGSFGIEEEYYKCTNCGYTDEFAYGGTRIVVKGKEFITWYCENHNKKIQTYKKIGKMIREAKRNYKKRKKKYL